MIAPNAEQVDQEGNTLNDDGTVTLHPLVQENLALRQELETWLPSVAKDDDRVLIYFAGHGFVYRAALTRAESLATISAAMTRIARRIEGGIPGARITTSRADNAVTKLIVRADFVQIKIEVTPVLRGTVYQPERRSVSPAGPKLPSEPAR